MNDTTTLFQFEIKIYVEDTDYGGIVYHPNYLKFMERARIEYLNQCGASLTTLQQQNILMVIRKASVHYHKPAFLNDVLLIETQMEPLKNTLLLFKHRVIKKENAAICCTGEIEVVCTNLEKKPVRLPKIFTAHPN